MFVGRSAQLRAITAELDGVTDGTAGVVHLVGEAGIGKTTLARKAAATAKDRGFTVAWGHAWSRSAAPPFWLWSQVLDALGTTLPMPDPEQGSAARSALLRGFLNLMGTAAAGRPLLVVLDDLHEADPASLTLTEALLRGLPDRPLLVLSTQRPGYERLDEVNRQGLRLPVPPFERADVAALIAAGGAGTDTDTDTVLHVTGGNPFLVTEALRTNPEAALRHRIGVRLAGLDEDTRRVVVAAAVVGSRPAPAGLATVAGLPPDRFTAAAARAATAGLLDERHGFRHAIVQEGCYTAVPERERAALHSAAADAIQRSGPLAEHLAMLAYHRRAAVPHGDPAAAVDASCAAARAALRSYAAEDAVAQVTAGLATVSAYGDGATAWRAGLLMLRGEAESMSGDPAAARRTVVEAIELATLASDPVLVGEATLRLPRVARFLAADPELERRLSTAVDLLGAAAPRLRIRLLARLAYDATMGEENGPASASATRRRTLMAQVVDEARALRDKALLAETLSASLFVAWAPDTARDRLSTGPEIARLGRETGELTRELDGLMWTFIGQLESGEVDQAQLTLSEYEYHAERGGQPIHRFYARSRAATLQALAGRYDEARRLAQEARQFALAAGTPDADSVYLSQLGAWAWALGGATAQEYLEACRTAGMLAHPLLAVIVHCYAGDPEDARLPVRATRGMLDQTPGPARLYAYKLLAEAAHLLDERDLAADLYGRLLPYADRCALSGGGAAAHGALSQALGLCAMTVGDLDTAVDWLRTAVERNRALGARPYVAASQADLADALIRQGSDPGDLLAAAGETAAALGLDRIAARVAQLAAAAGDVVADRNSVARAMLVLGADVDDCLLAAACDLPPERFVAARARPADSPGPDLTPQERGRLHLRAADAIERLGMRRRRLRQLALHRRAALPVGDPLAAVRATVDAARDALRRYQPQEAAEECTAALAAIAPYGATAREWRAELLVVLGTAQAEAGELTDARHTLMDAIDLADVADAPALAAEAALRLPLAERFIPNSGVIEAALRDRLDDAGPEQRVRLLARLGADALAARPRAEAERAALVEQAVAEARVLGDGALVAEALCARVRTFLGRDDIAERLAVSAEIVALGRHHDLPAVELEGRLNLFYSLLESGRVDQAAIELHLYETLADRIGEPRFLMYARSRRGTLAALRGDFATAERLAVEAWELGRTRTPNATQLLRLQRYAIGWSRGRIDPAALAESTNIVAPAYPLLLTVGLFEEGRIDEARIQLRASLGLLPELGASARLFALAGLAELAFLLDDAASAAEVRAALSPFADRCIIVGTGSGCVGAATRALGLCAATTGDLDGAAGELRDAVERNRRYGALPFVAAALAELAEVLRRRGRPADAAEADTLRAEAETLAGSLDMSLRTPAPSVPSPAGTPVALTRQGDMWCLAFQGRTTHLRPSKGLEQLAMLLSNPGREITAVELAGGVDTGDRVPVLDESAKLDYKRRLAALDAEIDHGDARAAARAERERDALVRELKSAAGLGGRTRHLADDAERARVNVTRTLRQALDQILAADAPAGLYLRAAVRTGTRCVYEAPGR